jgi:hypothetical protein
MTLRRRKQRNAVSLTKGHFIASYVPRAAMTSFIKPNGD